VKLLQLLEKWYLRKNYIFSRIETCFLFCFLVITKHNTHPYNGCESKTKVISAHARIELFAALKNKINGDNFVLPIIN